MSERIEKYMEMAVQLSEQGMDIGHGGPFGCVIVKGDEVVGRGWNRVICDGDPTAHAEVVAIRDACKNLGSFQLDGCEVYASCEPCPMCLGAIYWARPARVYFANTRTDAAAIGFDDSFIYEELNRDPLQRHIEVKHVPSEAAAKVFRKWVEKADKKAY